jgi:hypothetical protein
VSTRFTPDEWALLADAPLLAAMMVLAAGRRGSLGGTLAVARAYAAARDREHTPLVTDLLAEGSPDVRARVRDREALACEAPAALRAATSLLARTAPEQERAEYARFVLDVATAAAHAGGEHRAAALREVASILSAGEPPE